MSILCYTIYIRKTQDAERRKRSKHMNVMKRAWEIYRTLVGDHRAKLSIALRLAWAEKKNAKEPKVMYTFLQLKRMRAAAREKIFAENPELRTLYLDGLEQEKTEKPITLEDIRREDREYLRSGEM